MREMRPALNCGPQMKTDIPSTTTSQIRCAVYTRKSTDEGLDQDFNSLDAQREAAEAFIRSQRGEGLVALPERYDDGGFGGGNRDRPALERLLAEVRGGTVDCVVVYKVDRLSRSLIDFAHIIEIFEKRSVSFVSVTQQFNTTNSLGRLTLNILLSFAQFEREIIHWRNFERLTTEFFRRQGYEVDLGKGRKDGGVDVRVWTDREAKAGPPMMLIQCKRYKDVVGIETVKAFWADVHFEGAEKGLIATTSSISGDAKKLRDVRKWPMSFAESDEVHRWARTMWRLAPEIDEEE